MAEKHEKNDKFKKDMNCPSCKEPLKYIEFERFICTWCHDVFKLHVKVTKSHYDDILHRTIVDEELHTLNRIKECDIETAKKYDLV